MHDRGMIKWAPFASVINGTVLLKEIAEENSRIEKPVLSSDQIEEIEMTIIETYTNKSIVEVIFYQASHYHKITGIITKIDSATKKIMINNKKYLFFSNIIKIIKKNT